jgi:glycerol-3-phosphate dehydrogenase
VKAHLSKKKTTITSLDLAIGTAMAKVFPQTCHHLCLWYNRKKFLENLAHIYQKNLTIKRELKRCVLESSTIHDFEG